MKKFGVILTFFVCLISIISISYASFLLDDDSSITMETSPVSINTSTSSLSDLNFTEVTKSKGFTYDVETSYIIIDEAKIELTISMNFTGIQKANSLGYNRYYLEFDISNNFNTINNTLLPQIYLSYASKTSYFNITRSNNKFTATMPLAQESIFDNNYLNYILNGNDRTNVKLVIDFTNCINMTTVLNEKTFDIEIGVRKGV